MITRQFPAMIAQGGSRALAGYLNIGLTLFVMLCVVVLLLNAVVRWVTVWLTAPATLVQQASAPAPADPFRESGG